MGPSRLMVFERLFDENDKSFISMDKRARELSKAFKKILSAKAFEKGPVEGQKMPLSRHFRVFLEELLPGFLYGCFFTLFFVIVDMSIDYSGRIGIHNVRALFEHLQNFHHAFW